MGSWYASHIMENMAVAYMRSSSKSNSASRECRSQRYKILGYSVEHSYKILEYFSDEGYSGISILRPGIDAMMKYLDENPNVRNVIITDISRLSRCNETFNELRIKFLSLGSVIISIDEPDYTIDQMIYIVRDKSERSEEDGSTVSKIMEAAVSLERLRLLDKFRNGKTVKLSMGEKTGGKICLGYSWNKKFVVVNEDEACVVRKIFELYMKQRSLSSVCRILKNLGMKSRSKKDFSPETVRYVLRNKFYISIIKHGDVTVDGIHESLIDKETFQTVQQILDLR